VMVTPNDQWHGTGILLGLSEVGQVIKGSVYTPNEKNMKRVVSVKIVKC